MKAKAIKMHGQGNDYIIIDLIDYVGKSCLATKDSVDWNSLAIRLSDRHFGIGGDGIVLIEEADVEQQKAEVMMRMFNADGSEAETCGTALRCVAFYFHEMYLISGLLHKLAITKSTDNKIYIHTLSGIKECIIDDFGIVSVNMGKVSLEKEMTIEIEGNNVYGYYINIGNPHFVVFENELLREKEDIWDKIGTHSAFPNKTNVENVEIKRPVSGIMSLDAIQIKIWERGSGFTLSCGSGACASAFISHKVMNLSDRIKVFVPGGEVLVQILGDSTCVLSGSVEKVFETEVRLV